MTGGIDIYDDNDDDDVDDDHEDDDGEEDWEKIQTERERHSVC